MNEIFVESVNQESLTNKEEELCVKAVEEVARESEAIAIRKEKLSKRHKGWKQSPLKPSPSGYKFFELLSALQKDIRRGNEKQALRWAIEIAECFSEIALWNKLRGIASEDIGLANSTAPSVIQTLENDYFDLKETNNKNKPERLPLVNAVVFLSSSLKSRIVDNLLNVVYEERDHENWNPPIPEYALDKHTLKWKQTGKSKQEGIEHFFEVGAKLNRPAIGDPYTEEAKECAKKNCE